MSRKPKRRAKVARPAAKRKAARAATRKTARKKSPPRRVAAASAPGDPLAVFVVAAARALDLPAKESWLPTITTNLQVTLAHAAKVLAFDLPDDAEPAPVFRA